jgi:hypothetical protein
MAWQKIIVSGSNAELNSLKVTGTVSGSVFSGSYVGDGSQLTGLSSGVTTFPVATPNGSSSNFDMTTQTLKFTTGSNHGFSFSQSLNGTNREINLTTPQDLRPSANPTFSGANITNNLTVGGDLVVNGNLTSLNTTNLDVEDRFILLNSGSVTGDGGIIVQSGSAFSGPAVGWKDSVQRWGVQQNTKLGSTSTSMTPEAYVGLIVDVDGGMSDSVTYQKRGNIKISGGEIFIFN